MALDGACAMNSAVAIALSPIGCSSARQTVASWCGEAALTPRFDLH
jgi:hypothetical protein